MLSEGFSWTLLRKEEIERHKCLCNNECPFNRLVSHSFVHITGKSKQMKKVDPVPPGLETESKKIRGK